MLRVILAASILASGALLAQTVEGNVVSSMTGAGIPGVTVFVQPQDGEIAYRATTDSKGKFRIDDVKDGAYRATYMDGVPLPRNFWPVPNQWDSSQPSRFQVTTGAGVVHLDVKMQPIGKLSGRVLDPAGKPVPNANLWLVSGGSGCKWPSCVSFSEQSKTNEKGEYSVTDLRVPGAWRVSATAPTSWNPPEPRDDRRLGWAQTFYPGATDPQFAAEIMVQPGGDLWNLDIKLAAVPVHRVRGVLLDLHGDPAPKLTVALSKGFGPTLHQETGSDGTFEFASVAEDEWRVSASVNINNGGVKRWAAQWIRVKDDDLSDVELRLTAPFSIHGKIVTEVPGGVPAPKLPSVRIALAAGAGLPSDPQGDIFQTSESDEPGELTVKDVFPGPYLIQVLPDSSTAPYYLDSIRLGDREALESDVPILSGAQPVTVTYKLGGGNVRGNIEACGAARVLLIPQDPARRRGDFIRTTNCGQNGAFEFTAVRPGEIRLIRLR